MKLTPKYGTTDDAKLTAQILKNIDTVCKTMGMKKQVQIISCEEDEYNADYIEFTVTGKLEIDVPILKYCKQNGIRLMINSRGSDYLNGILNSYNIIVDQVPTPDYEPTLGLQFTYHPAPGADEEELTFSWYGEDALSDKEYKEAYEDAKQWVDEHPGSYITSGEDVIYRGKMVQILGQLNFLEGEDGVRAKRVFEPGTE